MKSPGRLLKALFHARRNSKKKQRKSPADAFLIDSLESRQLLSTATVNWTDLKQSIDGFGASTAWASGTWSSSVMNYLFSTTSGIGLSLLRSRVTPYVGSTENLIMQQAQAYGVKCWSTPWTAPMEWKTNHQTANGGDLESAHYQDYANALADYVQDMQRQGVNLYALSIQNEPNWTADYESCRWTAQQFADFLPFLGQTFASRNITTKIMLPEGMNWNFDLANVVMADPNLAKYVGILAAHNYGENSGSWKKPTNTQGKPIWETEISSFATGEIEMAIDTADDIWQAMTLGYANAYHYWWLNYSGAAALLNNSQPTKRFWAMGNYSKFIRPGWVRVGATEDSSSGLDISSYKDPATGKFAIVVVNKSSTAAVSESFTLSGVSANSVTPYITSSTLDLAAQGAVALTSGNRFSYSIPANSIITFTGQSSASPTLEPPTNLTVNPVQNNLTTQLALSWNDNSSSETAYTVERSTNSSSWSVLTTTAAANTVYYTSTGLSENTLYYFRVKPTNGDSSTYSAIVSNSTILAAPSNLSLSRQSNGVKLSWTLNSSVSTGVTIERSLDGLAWTSVATLASRATSYTHTFAGYNASQIYYYRVRNSVASKLSSFTQAYTGVTTPTLIANLVTPTSITFTWSNSTTGYSGVYIEQNKSGSWSLISAGLTTSSNSFTLTGLTDLTSYSFRVRQSTDGERYYTNYSSTLNITTPFQTLWYKANENSGSTLNDSFQSSNNAVLSGAFSFGAGVSGNALTLSGGYASLPAGILVGVNDFTLATWVKPSALANGARIIDFGTGAANCMVLSMQADGKPLFVITSNGTTQQIASNIAIPAGSWSHIALTLSGNVATIYINGVSAGSISNMTLHPTTLGSTTANYLGQSQNADSKFTGALDDFQIYGRAFTSSEILSLATPNTQLTWYKANETVGGVLSDSSTQHNDASFSNPAYAPGVSSNAMNLTGASAATLPVGIMGGINNFTIAAWVKASSLDGWARLFDFGTSTSNYMFLTLKPGSSGNPRFAITTGSGEQTINSNASISANAWFHIAVTLSGNLATMYINGASVGTNPNMTIHPANLGATTQNYIGDSQWSNDPYLKALVDDFRIYGRALSASEITQLALPTIVSPAFASPNPASSSFTNLSALGDDVTAGESALIYTWTVIGTPPAPVTFSSNGTNAAKNTIAYFTQPGVYNFQVSIVNAALAGVSTFTKTSSITVTVNSAVEARRLFYNNSALDNNNPQANSDDDNAIDYSKTPWLGDQPASFNNYSGYVKGLNGVMIDFNRLQNAASLSSADFIFRVGNTADPSAWSIAPTPQIDVRTLPTGSDRVTLVWSDGAIKNQWLFVEVLATANTGLASPDCFCFGNQIGETGNSASDAAVDAADADIIKAHYTGFLPADIYNIHDLNHDLAVDALDVNAVVNNYSGAASLLLLPAQILAPIAPAQAVLFLPPKQILLQPSTGGINTDAAMAAILNASRAAQKTTPPPVLKNLKLTLKLPVLKFKKSKAKHAK